MPETTSHPHRPGHNVPQILQTGLFLGSSLLVLGVFLFTQQMIGRLSHEVTTTSRVLARFCAQASFPATRDPELQQIFAGVIASVDFPIIITDADSLPRAWRGIGVDPALVPSASLDSLAQGFPISPVIRERLDRVRGRVAALDRRNEPIYMKPPGSVFTMGAVHYGDPPVIERLRWLPLATGAGVALLLSLGLWGLAIIRTAERRSIWVGMAKETAHQLGTPLSSLMGWAELLHGRTEGVPPGGVVSIPVEDLNETVTEMGRDLDRLNDVAQRFGRVGSAPDLKRVDITPVVQDVVAYMRRRTTQAPGGVVIEESYAPVPEVSASPELLEWALENLISNALSALETREGRIEVRLSPRNDGRAIELVVRDNGRGMSQKEQRRAFEAGYTSKRRGWGLGLALARRVVQEYHGGQIFIRQSMPGQGTTMVISLPVPRG